MYDIALTAAACLRAGTRVDVAWVVETEGFAEVDLGEALALTPGGGRAGGLLGGAADGRVADVVRGLGERGRLVDVEVTDIDALIAGLPSGGRASLLVVPGEQLPAAVWELLDRREPVCLVTRLDAGDVRDVQLFTAQTVSGAGVEAERSFAAGGSVASRTADAVINVFRPTPTLVVVGSGPHVSGLQPAADLLGWKVRSVGDLATAKGLVTALSSVDSLVVTGHDPDLAGAVVETALATPVGYIGVLGGQRAQRQLVDWLAYREVTDLARVHGPAGLDIGATSPAEVALSVLAEAVAAHRLGRRDG